MPDAPPIRPVLILGAGINGCAVARELALNKAPVYVVDQADIAYGATAKSSRLIHGGLRYLEYGDFPLVAESLHERERLLTLAPQFVRPLKLHIPVSRRFGGLAQSALRFFGASRFSVGRWLSSHRPVRSQRGLLVVRMGLFLYDWIARSSLLPEHSLQPVGSEGTPAIDSRQFHWLCSYYDAQMRSPERFVIALLEDARRAAAASGVDFRVLTYHRAEFSNGTVTIRALDEDTAEWTFEPSTIINATGAWGDLTLEQIDVPAERLLGGTKGSHFITRHAGLKDALGDGGVYAEAADGRLVFILPFFHSVLVGTTDERFQGSPAKAVASEEELKYLVSMVNEVFPQVGLRRADVNLHYSGVRPLPFVPSGKPGAIPRGHWRHSTVKDGIPIETLIGGKLTTCRAFAEEVADHVLQRLSIPRSVETRERLIPGAEGYPEDERAWCAKLAAAAACSPDQVAAVFRLIGTRAAEILMEIDGNSEVIPGTSLPVTFVDWIIQHEWVQTLGDLVERRLELIFSPGLSPETLASLADRLVLSGQLRSEERGAAIDACSAGLQERYGIAFNAAAKMRNP